MKKRFLALLLSLAMVFSLQPLAAYAEDDVNSSNETTEMQVDTQEETPNENIIESNNEQPPVETPAPETETPPQTSEQPSASVNEETQTKAKSSMILKKAPTYTLHYDANGGVGAPLDCKGTRDGSWVRYPLSEIEPTRYGYVFFGWTKVRNDKSVSWKAVGPGAIIHFDSSQQNVTLYAYWKEDINHNNKADDEEAKYTVTYTDGVGGVAFKDQVTTDLLSGLDTPSFKGTPSRYGYIFDGWDAKVADKVTGNATYTAKWKQIHEWHYEAEGNVVKAICPLNECMYKDKWLQLILSAENMEYTGKAYNRASITKNEITNITGAAAGAISYEGRDGTIYTQSQTAPTNVGKYAAKVTIGGKTAVANFEITKLTASANVKFAADLTYNGQNQNLVLNATTTGGTLMYRLSDTDEWKAGLVMLTGKDAGDYHIQYYVKAKANYADSEVQTATVTIQPYAVRVFGIRVKDKTYDGTTDATLDYSHVTVSIIDGRKPTVTATGTFADKNAGTDKMVHISNITLSGDAAKNYKLAKSGNQDSATANILRKDVTVTINPNGGTYGNVKPATASLNGVVSGDDVSTTLSYSGNTNNGTTIQNATNAPTEAGSYRVNAGLAGKDMGNYKLTGSTEEKFDVLRADPKLNVTAVPEKKYGDENFKLEVTKKGEGALSYTSSNTNVLTVDEKGNVTLHKAGSATITVKLAKTDNYLGDTKTVDVKVKKVSGHLEVTTLSYSKTYGDAPFQFVDAISTTGTISYKSSNKDVVTVSKDGTVTIHNKGLATITVSVPEGDNHTPVSKKINITVEPKAITVKAKDASKIYGDSDPELTYEVLNDGLVGNDTLKGIKVEREKGEDVKPGGYTIFVDDESSIVQSIRNLFGANQNENYRITYKPGVFTINPKDISDAKVTLGDSLTYNGKEQTQTIAKVEVDGIEVPADAYMVTGNIAKNAGTYTLTIIANEGGNFTGTREVNYTIAKGNAKVTKSTKPGQNNTPKTGESTQTFLWLSVMFVSICGLAGIILVSKKTRYKDRFSK